MNNDNLYVEAALSSTAYSTSMGSCTFGEPCELGIFTLTLDPGSFDDDDDDDDDWPSVCLQDVSTFQLAPGSSLALDDDCLKVTDADQLAGLSVVFDYGASSTDYVTATDFEFWPSTAKLTYTVERYSYSDLVFTQQCSVDGDDATCDVINPYNMSADDDEVEAQSLASTLLSMAGELLSGLLG